MPRPQPVPRRFRTGLRAGVASLLAVCLAVSGAVAVAGDPASGPDGLAMRVESEVTSGGGTEPLARSLTLFRDGVAWNFLELPHDGAGSRLELVEIALHDPARERIVVVDPVRNLKTEVAAVRLERLGVSLAKWARESDDRLVRWAGGPDFDSGLVEDEDGRLELAGPRVRYAVTHAAAPSPAAAAAYRRFADGAILLKALLHPGGVPPFPRLALNRQLEAAGAIPEQVTLEIEPRLGPLAGRPERLTSTHRGHPRLLAADLSRIEEAEAHVAAARAVDLATFAGPAAEATRHDP
jgi:hypothetical protein